MASTSTSLSSLPPPPPVPNVKLSLPSPHVLLVTLDRPQALNAIPAAQHPAMAALWAWYDAQPQLRCAVLTGGDGRAFCAGADLREWDQRNNSSGGGTSHRQAGKAEAGEAARYREVWTQEGFGGLSNRAGKKPVVAAVNGLCFGGGMEMAINCDLVVADGARARFGLPEVGKGVIAVAGALPRLIRTVGRQRAAEMALLGRTGYTAEQMREWGLVNFVVGEGKAVEEAIKVAEEIAGNSPDAVITSREGLRLGWEPLGPQMGTEVLERGMYGRMDGGENMKEGVRSFVEKRKPVWKDSKL
ncbi:ClpP/crotonase-like domain-containing protein [Corynascus novoguineensis]|uniref:ClpP/crotonase-like domain-containing protein n=1 Tax=Corynascus novoguineensis TaxID=1126955 RepID=A0AAN7D0E3_9PEZI|nr:ClpP/crotonase-like domain-containing protein [Corynascus novoguineensis]